MTVRQMFLKLTYPFWMWFAKRKAKKIQHYSNNELKKPLQSFYQLHYTRNNSNPLNFSKLKGKKVMLVNTASDCGFTNQYADLQKLYSQFQNKLEILAFPANDFKEQEKGSDEEIAQFCKINFGVTFPLMKKSSVKKSREQNAIFQWLTNADINGWNNKQPSWNFSKYLVNEEGILTDYFGPSVSPLSNEVLNAIH